MIGSKFWKGIMLVIAVMVATGTAFGQTTSSAGVILNALALLRGGDQISAERLVSMELSGNPKDQSLAFYNAALLRSRFQVDEAYVAFRQTAALDGTTLYGRVSELIMALDVASDVQASFTELDTIVEQNGSDMMLRWLLAMECRSFELNNRTSSQDRAEYARIGIAQYQQILSQWSPGPVLVHQTFANLLDGRRRPAEALPHRYLTVQLEPKSWSYQGLWLTLFELERYQEAKVAIERALQYAPGDASFKANLALTIRRLTSDRP